MCELTLEEEQRVVDAAAETARRLMSTMGLTHRDLELRPGVLTALAVLALNPEGAEALVRAVQDAEVRECASALRVCREG